MKQFAWQTTERSRGLRRPSWKIEARTASGFSKGWVTTFLVTTLSREQAVHDLIETGEFDHLWIYSAGRSYCPKCTEEHVCRGCWSLVGESIPHWAAPTESGREVEA